MIIQIVDINLNRRKLIRHAGTQLIHGYWIRFTHSDFEGTANFVPYNKKPEEIILNTDYSVETSQEKHLHILKLKTEHLILNTKVQMRELILQEK